MAHSVKKSRKKTVSFEKSVSFSDDPPPPPPVTNGFKKDGMGRSDRGESNDKNKHLSSKNFSVKHATERYLNIYKQCCQHYSLAANAPYMKLKRSIFFNFEDQFKVLSIKYGNLV